MEHYVLYLAIVILGYCLFAGKMSEWAITMPMVFLLFGILVGLQGVILNHETAEQFHLLAELTLSMLLFADATQLRRDALEKIGERTARMLLLGLPIAILFGSLLNVMLLPDWPLWEACLLAALLAPTDAALGQAIQSNQKIPIAFRNAMNAESGLNDGLALPFVIFFAGLAIERTPEAAAEGTLLHLLATQIGLGVLAGIAVGCAVGIARNFSIKHRLMDEGLARVGMLAAVGVTYFAAEHIGGNSFVAVFISGIAFANTAKGSVHQAREFIEGDGQFLAMLSFFFIGALFVPEALNHATWVGLAVVCLSLVLVRPVAIWISLMGTNTAPNERLFYGWFGPRGLATALFAVFVAMDFEGLTRINDIIVISMMAVVVSAFVHGISAKWAPQIFRLGSSAEPNHQDRP
ncbi:sodium:proton antiporter [Phaeobacter gallaeciensis]|uniref:Sodium:proton antiporter n=2 Tax=Roseobacteraceae TaxID=2854170 RepID=A0A366X999_9RHOB|nr:MULTISPECIES: cation:proton antiporter [Roseobacteraceae]MBT3142499.1 cation:proton antiporter [Falsiruegeria litorea]MBT8169273.1 cation:proton antiporter [Falsiruegeria litorea]RBW60510.1 sodium:proton antiporter [Phaeobacter gallaeciensis]